MSSLLQCSRTGSHLLCEVLCCLSIITSLRLLQRFLILWPWQTLFLFVRMLPSVLSLNSIKVPSRFWLVLVSFLLCGWIPEPTMFQSTTVLTLCLTTRLASSACSGSGSGEACCFPSTESSTMCTSYSFIYSTFKMMQGGSYCSSYECRPS